MSTNVSILLVYLVLAATLGRAVLMADHRGPSTCTRCGRSFERRELGEQICGCRDH
jgi:hypothetical protein